MCLFVCLSVNALTPEPLELSSSNFRASSYIIKINTSHTAPESAYKFAILAGPSLTTEAADSLCPPTAGTIKPGTPTAGTAVVRIRWRLHVGNELVAVGTITGNHPLSPAYRRTQIGRMRQRVNVWFHLVLRLQASTALQEENWSGTRDA